MVHDTNAIGAFDYILPLMVSLFRTYDGLLLLIILQPELFRFTESECSTMLPDLRNGLNSL